MNDQGIAWVGQCTFICNKFGVGMDSVRSKILLLRTALNAGLALSDLNTHTNNLFKNYASVEHLAQATLTESIRIGNFAEQGSTLSILAELAWRNADGRKSAFFRRQAIAIYRKLNRPDLIRELKKNSGAIPVK
jgi:hypothetical protein